MKKQLNEELSRISSMMRMISEEEFEDTSKPSETIINDVKQSLRNFLNQDNPQADETEVESDGGWFVIDGGEDKYIKYYFDVNVKSYGRTTPGRNYMDNGDPGYPDEHEPMDYEITVTQIEVGGTVLQDDKWVDNVEYVGPDFTDFMSLSFKNGMSGDQWLYDTFDERILETDIDEEINNNINENKKMSKKITITESQLQRLMERKHSYTDNTPEGEMEEQESIGPDSAIIDIDKEEEEEVEEGLKDNTPHPDKIKWSDFVIGEKVKITRGVEEGEEGTLEGLSIQGYSASVKLDRTGETYLTTVNTITPVDLVKNDEEDGQDDIPGFENTLDDLDNALSIRESVESIKSNFKRFL